MLAMMTMGDRSVQHQRHAVAADIDNRALFNQRVIVAGGDGNPFTDAPVHRLRQTDRVVSRRDAAAERYPGGALLAMQVDGAAIERGEELAAERRVRNHTRRGRTA